MIDIDIPGFGQVRLEHLVTDFTGTISVDGRLLPGINGPLNKIAKSLKIHVLTADTFGTAEAELNGADRELHVIKGGNQDVQKEEYVKKLGATSVIAIGNGNNDRLMLKAARVGIAVTEGEGCSVGAIMNADIHVRSAAEGLDLILNPKRLKATLRF